MTTTKRRITITGVRVVDVMSPELKATDPVSIEIADGTIVSISTTSRTGTDVIDGAGQLLLPGLVNSHDHLYSKELRHPTPGHDLRTMRQLIDRRDEATTVAVMIRNAWHAMAQGILTVRDLGARHGLNTQVAAIFSSQIVPGPLLIASGRPIVMTGGHVWTFGRESDGPSECRRAVREQRKAGARVIKIMASGGLSNYPQEDYSVPEFTSEELDAIIGEAHKLGLPTCAHAFGTDAIESAVRAGVDSIEHGVHLDDGVIEMMVSNETSYVPTIANMRRIASSEMNAEDESANRIDLFDREVVAPQAASVRRAIEAGIKIGIGTDSTGTYLEEILALREVGMPETQIVRAATSDGATICRSGTGVIEPGRPALFNLYETDPRSDATKLVEPTSVFLRDRLFARNQLTEWIGPSAGRPEEA